MQGMLPVVVPIDVKPLSPRETEIVKLIADGLTVKEIAVRLCIEVNTVQTHRVKVGWKLGVPNNAALTAWAFRSGLVR